LFEEFTTDAGSTHGDINSQRSNLSQVIPQNVQRTAPHDISVNLSHPKFLHVFIQGHLGLRQQDSIGAVSINESSDG
jgi:hypothetical protein